MILCFIAYNYMKAHIFHAKVPPLHYNGYWYRLGMESWDEFQSESVMKVLHDKRNMEIENGLN